MPAPIAAVCIPPVRPISKFMPGDIKQITSPVIAFLLLVGCSGVEAEVTPGIEKIRVESAGADPTGLIGDTVPLADILAAFEARVEIDPVTKVHRLRGQGIVAALCPGMPWMLVNGQFIRLSNPVVHQNGETRIPSEVARILREIKASSVRRPRASKPKPRIEVRPRPKMTIILDAGHGGKDPGALGKNGLQEKAVNLGVAQKLHRLLELKGHKVILTRSSDRYLTLQQRTELCRKHQPDLFISIHANSAANLTATGIETYYSATRMSLGSGKDRGPRLGDLDKRFAGVNGRLLPEAKKLVYKIYFGEFQDEGHRLATEIQNSLVSAFPDKPNRGVKAGRWFVVRWSQAPAILVELGFLSNSKTESQMKSPAYQEKLAKALLNGIEGYVGQ